MAHSIPGVSHSRLERRLAFLLDRAGAHREGAPEDMLSRACAATLWRDAACVAVLLDQAGHARKLFTRAGHEFLALGLPIGASLVALANVRDARQDLFDYSDVIDGARQWGPGKAREHHAFPIADMARGSPRQLLSIKQLDWLTAETEGSDSVRPDEPIRAALKRNGGYPVGATGLSIDSYAEVADWAVAKRTKRDHKIPKQVRSSITTMAAVRGENLLAAQKDTFHWRLLARPAELVDLDATILMFVALGAGMNTEQLAKMMRERDVPMNDTPLNVAASLRSNQDLP